MSTACFSHRTRVLRCFLVALFVALGLLWMGTAAWAEPKSATRYVAPSGVDSGACASAAAPCRTIQYAHNQAASGDVIRIAAGVYGENVTLSKSITLHGASAASTIIDGGQQQRVIRIDYLPATNVLVRNVTLRNGTGGILSGAGPLTIQDSVIRNNQGDPNSGVNRDGGGVFGFGPVTIVNTSIYSNTALYGGGVYARAPVTITQSAIYDNVAEWGGGVTLSMANGDQARIVNSTISRNTTQFGVGGVYNETPNSVLTLRHAAVVFNRSTDTQSPGIGIGANMAVRMEYSIVANNSGPAGSAQCAGVGNYQSLGYNVASDSSCRLTAAGDRPGVDPLLGPLRNNGGPTWTHAIGPGSPALDAGNNATCLSVDQRGQPRPVDGDGDGVAVCDIGPYERAAGALLRVYLPRITR
jgi:hypothetical protein